MSLDYFPVIQIVFELKCMLELRQVKKRTPLVIVRVTSGKVFVDVLSVVETGNEWKRIACGRWADEAFVGVEFAEKIFGDEAGAVICLR